jgi:hypothetical protein
MARAVRRWFWKMLPFLVLALTVSVVIAWASYVIKAGML